MAFDFKKAYKDLYLPKGKPSIVDVPEMTFIMINGKGDPNEEGGEYQKAVSLLYSLCYTIKMSKMAVKKGGKLLDGYYDYSVPPLEGLWWNIDPRKGPIGDKSKFHWISMIRQPEFVTPDVFKWACDEVIAKKPEVGERLSMLIAKQEKSSTPIAGLARLEKFTEGLCVQIMHYGSYDDEPGTVKLMDDFVADKTNGIENAIEEVQTDGHVRYHHEIYLGDPRKGDIAKCRTVIRHPIKRISD